MSINKLYKKLHFFALIFTLLIFTVFTSACGDKGGGNCGMSYYGVPSPTQTVYPDNPVNPVNPDNPVNPVEPDNPVNPDEPDNPVNPDEPDEPADDGTIHVALSDRTLDHLFELGLVDCDSHNKSSLSKINIPETYTYDGNEYKITSIVGNLFFSVLFT